MNDVTSNVAMTTYAEHAVKAQFCHHMGTAEKENVNFVMVRRQLLNFVLITLLSFFPCWKSMFHI